MCGKPKNSPDINKEKKGWIVAIIERTYAGQKWLTAQCPV